MKVKCDHAIEKCENLGCPHSKPHRPHKAKQTQWDGNKPCIERDLCSSFAEIVQCVEVPSE